MEICPDLFNKDVIIDVVANVIAGVLVCVILWLFRKSLKTTFIEPIKTFKENRRIRKLLISRNYHMIYNPTSGYKKPIKFGDDGQITEGQNNNEYTWKVAKRKLEIYASDKLIYSRFIYNQNTDRFENSNDSDTRSIRNQIIEPQWTKVQ